MTTVSDLLTQLQKRLGITSPTARESDRLTESLYAAILRAAEDGLAGVGDSNVTGETYGSSSITVSAHTANTSTLTLSAVPTGTRANDVLKIGTNLYSVYSVSGSDIDVGGPIRDSLAGETGTVYRRTVPLPHTGPVYRVWSLTDGGPLEHTPDGFGKYRYETGCARGYEVNHDRDNEQALIVLWPIPDSETRLIISQRLSWDTVSTATTLPFPDSTLDSIMTNATHIWRTWKTGGVSPMELEGSRQDVKDAGTARRKGGKEAQVNDPLTRRV